MSDEVKYELVMTAEAEVIPGQLTRIRQLCQAAIANEGVYPFDSVSGVAETILEIINEG